MPFIRPPRVDVDPDGCTFTLVEPAHYIGKTDDWEIPRGFSTDFASIPTVLTWLVPKLGGYSRAAIVHDYFCVNLADRYRGLRELDGDEVARIVSARDADAIFRRIMREDGVDVITRWLVWTGVRWGAVANPARRPGWLKDAPAVLAISLASLPVVLPATVLAEVGRQIFRGVDLIARHFVS